MNALTLRIVKTLGLFGGVQGVGIVCSLVRAKLIALWIGPVGVGLFGIFNSVLDMVSNASQLNMRTSAVRNISSAEPSQLGALAASVRWWARNLGFLGSLIMLVGSPLLSWVSFGDFSLWWAFASLGVPLFCLALVSGEQALMQGAGQLRRLARASLIGIVAGTVASVPMYYFWGEGSIIPSICVFALASLAAVLITKDIKSQWLAVRERFRLGKDFMRLGVYMTISSLAATGASYVFLSYLNHVADTAVTGVYQAGYTLVVKYLGLVFSAIAVEYYPRLARLTHEPEQLRSHVSHEAYVLMWIAVPVSMLMILCAPWVIPLLYSAEFLPAVPLVQIGIVGAVFRVVSYCLSYVILAKGDGRAYVCTEVASAAVGLSLNIVMYNLWGLAGLGASYVAWYAIYTLMVAAVCKLRYGLCLNRRALGFSAFALLVVGLTAFAACMAR